MSSLTIGQALQQALQHYASRRFPEAEKIYRQVLAHQPNNAQALHMLGALAHQAGRYPLAIELIEKAIQVDPSQPEFYCNLGASLNALGQMDSAVATLRKAVALNPNLPEAHCNLGHALYKAKQYHESIVASRAALQLRPNFAEPYNNLGNAYSALQMGDEAIEAYRNAIRFQPNYSRVYTNLANLLTWLGRYEEALTASREAIRISPGFADAYMVYANVFRLQGKMDEARDLLERALQMSPSSAVAYDALGMVLTHSGRVDDAINAFRESVALDPTNATHHSNLIYTLQFSPTQGQVETMSAELRKWSERHEAPLKDQIKPHSNDPNPDRPLRIGYVSPDFFNHCQSFFTIPLLSNTDRSSFESICYASVRKPDVITDRIKQLASGWRDISSLSNAEAADLIRADGIDILVDLTQHMSNNRLLIFAYKPAPVQIAWLGYPGSTGLKAIDYRLSDPHLDPPGAYDSFYSEKTIRLPETFWCYDPLTSEPAVNALPAGENGFITFGSLNNFSKVNDHVLSLWARAMQVSPGSKLIMLSRAGKHRQRTLDAMSQLGIDPSRVSILDGCSRADYLKLYHRIDICLDTLPYNGHTTSLDALWMGVPVISLVGNTPVGRAGLSLLSNVGLTELLAENEEQFVQIAQQLSSDLPRLSELRRTLRPRMEASPLMDAARFARHVEMVYRQCWRQWCEERAASKPSGIQLSR